MKPLPANTAFLLLVEGDPNVLALASSTLSLSGYHIRTAITRPEVFAQLDSGLCAAMLLDLGLPGDDGIRIARAVRERSAVPILMLTGRVSIHERVESNQAFLVVRKLELKERPIGIQLDVLPAVKAVKTLRYCG